MKAGLNTCEGEMERFVDVKPVRGWSGPQGESQSGCPAVS